MNTYPQVWAVISYVGTAILSFGCGVALGVFTNFINGRIGRLREFRAEIHGQISKIQISTHDGNWKEILKESGRMIHNRHAAIAEDIHFWRRRKFQNACLQYSNHEIIREFAEQATDKLFGTKEVELPDIIAGLTQCDNERAWAANALAKIIRFAKFSPF